ncbi:hypothetical protein [uncultured Paraglaciecola sp.]|uniref:hypothetical protein n=1 Tax=uncultured Paraglaciecola sp. TaxID=1765024 RepID=UPI00262035C5|nr:hypothetical protein [uncultured Paraglaciecola sp.]
MYKLTFIAIILLSGCMTGKETKADTQSKAEVLPEVQQQTSLNSVSQHALGSEVTLSAGEELAYQEIKLAVIAVEDSRCPTGEQCIWEGQVKVTLEVSNNHSEKTVVTLLNQPKSATANALGYRIRLVDVAPHPKKGKVIPQLSQIIKLQIDKI